MRRHRRRRHLRYVVDGRRGRGDEFPDGEQWSVGLKGTYDAFGFGLTYVKLNSDTTDVGEFEADNLLVGASFGWDAFAVGCVYGKILSADGELAATSTATTPTSCRRSTTSAAAPGQRRCRARPTTSSASATTTASDSAWIGDFGISMAF